jgi:hypothetical protein
MHAEVLKITNEVQTDAEVGVAKTIYLPQG